MTVSPAASDDDLLRRLRAGDEAAFTALYVRRQGGVYRFALRMSGSPAIAEDVMQETFLALIREPERYNSLRGTLSSYLYGIARNHVLRRLQGDGKFAAPEDPSVAPPDPLAELMLRERSGLVWRAVLALPPHYREVIVLCELESLSYAAAAEILDCAVGTVRSRLSRARELLGEKLRGLDPPHSARGERRRGETYDAL